MTASAGTQPTSTKTTAGPPAEKPDSAVQISGNGAAALITTNSLAFSVVEEDALVERFGREAHEDGMAARRSATVSITHVLKTGEIIARRYRSEGADRKRGSKYGAWCRTYLDWLGQKTCDRWRMAYKAFQPFLNDPERADEFAPAWENLQLTTLYRLSEIGVPREAKEEALELAKRKQVTPNMAVAIIEDCGGKAQPPRQSTPKSPQTQKVDASMHGGVKVTVRYPKNTGKRAALTCAIEGLQKEMADQRLEQAPKKESAVSGAN